MQSDIAWTIEDYENGGKPPGIPAWRCYPSEDKAKRAAIRAAKAHGCAVSWGWRRPWAHGGLKYVCGTIPAPQSKGE